MKRLVTVIWMLIFVCPLFAALKSLEDYSNFTIKKELLICTSIAFPVDISYDAFNVDYKTVVQARHGYFVQVLPGMHTDGSVLPDNSVTVQNPSRGVLNVVGKPAGVYEYVFISTDNDGFCGMAAGEQSVVRVYLVPQLTGFPVLTNVCPGETVPVDFNRFIPPEIQYFLDEMGWTLSWYRDGAEIQMPLNAGLSGSGIGDMEYRYSINDNSGEYSGKYTELQSSPYACPEDSATLTHTVRVREGGEYAIPNKHISFCTDVLSLVPETWPTLNTNLFGYLGSSMPNGKWSLEHARGYTFSQTEFPIDENSGKVSIPLTFLAALQVDSIVFKYSYKDCMANDTFTLLSFNFDKSDFTGAFSEKERDICRNLMSGVVELSSIFGFTVPLTSGIWYSKNGDDFEEMLYGAVDISEMRSGSLYTFRYDVNSAVDSICLIQGSQTMFHLRMHDFDIPNAEVKICKSQFAAGVTVNLSRYVPGLADIGDMSKITWRDSGGTEIPDPANYTLRATEEWQTHDTTNFHMRYSYEVRSDCGPYSGSLSISALDSIANDTARRIMICYTDDYASHVDLFQILGIVGADGNFDLCDDPVNERGGRIDISGARRDTLDAVGRTGIMNANFLFNTANESETYNFCYIPGRNDTCLRGKMEITVTVTRNVKNGSKFENGE